jgi:hypothetical protein
MKSLKRTRVPGELPDERAGHRDRLAGEDAHHMIMDYLNVSVPSFYITTNSNQLKSFLFERHKHKNTIVMRLTTCCEKKQVHFRN